jgi:IS1 family transposase
LQLDEKWSYVFKKQKHCDLEDAADHRKGECWDHMVFDPETRLVLAVEVAKRSGSSVLRLLKRAREQLRQKTPRLISSDNFGPYATCIELVFGQPQRPAPSGQGKAKPALAAATTSPLNYATVCKRRRNGRVVKVERKVVFGTQTSVAAALEASKASCAVNTSFVERHNATDRHRNARKGRRTYRFSKDWAVHEAASRFIHYSYNFCWCVRTLRGKRKHGKHQPRTPAMAARLTDHVWTIGQWLRRPVPMDST